MIPHVIRLGTSKRHKVFVFEKFWLLELTNGRYKTCPLLLSLKIYIHYSKQRYNEPWPMYNGEICLIIANLDNFLTGTPYFQSFGSSRHNRILSNVLFNPYNIEPLLPEQNVLNNFLAYFLWLMNKSLHLYLIMI